MNVDSVLKVAMGSKDDSVSFINYYRAFTILLEIGDLKKADSVLTIQENLHSKYRKASVFSLLARGQLQEIQGKYRESTESLLKALKIAEENHFDKQVSDICNSLGILHFTQEEYDKALKYYFQALDVVKKNNHEKSLPTLYNNIGNIYYKKRDFTQALNYYNMAILYVRKTGDKSRLANFLNNIGSLHMELKDFDKAMEVMKEATALLEKENNKFNLAYSYLNEGMIYAEKKDFAKAEKRLKQATDLSVEVNSPEMKRDVYYGYSEFYRLKNEAGKTLDFYKRFVTLRDSLSNSGMSEVINKKESDYEFEKKEILLKSENEKKEIQLAEERKRNRLVMIFTVSVLLIIAVFALFLYKKYRLTEKQKKVIEEKTEEIIDSINYAQRLQGALLQPEDELKKHFAEVFILYKPRDIVSGDFYWFSESSENRIIAVADCTGHGVPGALMSMLGYESLQNTVLKESINSTSQALKTLDQKITGTLNKTGKSMRDGMDIALCAFSKNENKVQFSGANRPLIHVSNGIVTEYSPDKNTIGGDIDGTSKEYSTKIIHYSKGDLFYMFTDGFADQFGGEKGKKFMFKQLKTKLQEVSHLPLNEQKQSLELTFNQWRGKLEQVDDICIIGLRL